MSSTTTSAPAARQAEAIAAPIPEAPPVIRARSPSSSLISGIPHRLPLLAEAIDFQLDHVTGPQVGPPLRVAERHPGRRPGVDHVAGVQRHELADVPDQV